MISQYNQLQLSSEIHRGGFLSNKSSNILCIIVTPAMYNVHPDDPRRMAANICGDHSIPPSSDQVSHAHYLNNFLFLGASRSSLLSF